MVETMPAFIAVVLGASHLVAGNDTGLATIATWVTVFFWVRVVYSIVYIFGIPFLRTPVYLVSWFTILAIATTAIMQ